MEIAFFILCFNAGIAILGVIIAWTRKKMPAAVPLIFLKIAVIFWSVGYAFELISPDLWQKLAWTIVQYIGIILIPLAALFLSFEHLRKKKLPSPFPIMPFLIIPVFVFIMLCTNEQHHLFYQKVDLIVLDEYAVMDTQYGCIFWIHTIYSYGLLITSMVLMIRALLILPSIYKRQTISIIIAYLIPWIANVIFILRLLPFIKLDPSPFAFSATGVIILFGLIYYNLFDFVPFAADTIINNLNDSIIILSLDNTLLKINPQAEILLKCTSTDCVGKKISVLLNRQFDPVSKMTFEEKNHIELKLSLDYEDCYLDCKVSPIRMGQRIVAKAVILRDITLLKKAQLSLKNWNMELEKRILRRTRELSDANDHLKQEIKKKELLLKEIHHRVKNNLAIIRSLIVIQAASIEDTVVRNMFKDLTSRVTSIGLIHEKLYRSEDFQTIDLESYIDELIKSHIATFSHIDSPLSFKNEIDKFSLNINIIIPLGLIFTELITNAIKYAKNDKGENIFKIQAKKKDDSVLIIVTDSGPGYPETVLKGKGLNTGLKLIEVLIEQLNGSVMFENSYGAKCTMRIAVQEIESK